MKKIINLFRKKNSHLKIHCGPMKGSYKYYKRWIKKHPTYDTIVSDYLPIE